MIQTFYTAKC